MKNKLLKAICLLSAVAMLSGCTKPYRAETPTPVLESEKENTVAIDPGTPFYNETVNLTEGRTPGRIENVTIENVQYDNLSNASVALLYQTALKEEDKSRNILLSPLSIQTALGMTELGAEGDTLKQMEEVVNGGVSHSELDTAMNLLAARMRKSQNVKWNVANSLWFRDNGLAQLKENYLNDVVTYYNSDIFYAPFDNQTLEDINGWVDEETNHMIPKILGEIPDDAYMYLINAVAFEAEWEEQYKDTQINENRRFENIDGSESDVTMLASTEYGYFNLEGGEGFIKPYKGGEYSFVAILPDENTTPEEYLNKLLTSKTDLSKAIREASDDEVHVMIPEFTLDYDIELSDIYKEMGMDIPFDPNRAEFHKMMEPVNNVDYDVWIGKILHKTHIEVDRKGTKAAAVTAVEMDLAMAALPMEEHYITLDRPFVYAIVENETGYPMFLGTQNSMN
ncbi:MAG: serpin family protein [Lachnospiraceae bacterium]|nr:serpin family protein [Lachnospiraceae bacterium]